MGQQRNVVFSIAQGGNLDRKDIEPVIQIFTKRLFPHGREQVAVCRRDHADIDADRRLSADAIELLLLQNAEQFRLHFQRDLPDLVEEDRPAVGQLESADALGDRAGEGPFLVAEKLALDQAGRKCGTVDLDQRLVAAADC